MYNPIKNFIKAEILTVNSLLPIFNRILLCCVPIYFPLAYLRGKFLGYVAVSIPLASVKGKFLSYLVIYCSLTSFLGKIELKYGSSREFPPNSQFELNVDNSPFYVIFSANGKM